MKLVKYRLANGQEAVGQLDDERLLPMDLSGRQYKTLSDILEAENPQEVADFLVRPNKALAAAGVQLLAPIDHQEVWAAGVTYRRSQTARMEESPTAASCYDRVYTAHRPELFFKATPHRVVGPGEAVRVRSDSKWTVPEPEVALLLSSSLGLAGFTIGNDMSSRDIEGENPLYLPQAKIYNGCCALGPCVTLAGQMPPRELIDISLVVRRGHEIVFQGQTNVSQMARTFGELLGWLERNNSFPTGAVLLTGTGIVPDSSFSLQNADEVEITIEGIGTLINPVVKT